MAPSPPTGNGNDGRAIAAAALRANAPAQPGVAAAPTLVKGMSFPDGKTAIFFVQDYALHHNKQVRVGCRGGKHRKLVCSWEACPFFVQIYQRHSKSDKSWYLSSFEATHAESCMSTAKPTKRQLVEMASFKDVLEHTPEASAGSLATFLKDQSSMPLRVNLRTVYRAKETLRNAMVDKQSQSFRRITSLIRQFSTLNDGVYATHDVDESGRFLRAFMSCGVFTRASQQNQQIFGYECVPAVGMFPGFHMYLLGKDSNRKTIIVAVATVASLRAVSGEHLAWFFRCVHAAGVDIQLTPIIAAVNTQLLSVEAELGLSFRICTKHVIEKELSKLTAFNEHHHTLVWGLQSSETPQEYNNRLHWIATACSQDVAAHLRQVSYERWVLASNMDMKPLYGWRSRDFTDGQGDNDNGVAAFIQQLQHKLPFDFLDAIMERWARDVFERNSAHEKWVQSGLKVTAGAQELYDQEVKHIGEFVVTRSSPSVAFVSQVNSSTNASTTRCRVDLDTNTCSCAFMQQHGIPCRHMIAVVLFCAQMETVTSRFASIYRTETFGSAYCGKTVELPLQNDLAENDDCLPPGMVVKVARGPKPKNRPPVNAAECSATATAEGEEADPNGEISTDQVAASRKSSKKRAPDMAVSSKADDADVAEPSFKPKRCSRCKSTGHNVRSCPEAAATPLPPHGPTAGTATGTGISISPGRSVDGVGSGCDIPHTASASF